MLIFSINIWFCRHYIKCLWWMRAVALGSFGIPSRASSTQKQFLRFMYFLPPSLSYSHTHTPTKPEVPICRTTMITTNKWLNFWYTGSRNKVPFETSRSDRLKVALSLPVSVIIRGALKACKFRGLLIIIFCNIFSQLPAFLGGTCTCEGGCLRSNKGPWNDPNVIKVKYTYYVTLFYFFVNLVYSKSKYISTFFSYKICSSQHLLILLFSIWWSHK